MRCVAGIVTLLVLALAHAGAQTHIQVDQCDTMQFSVTSRPNIPETYFIWDIYNSSTDPVDVLDASIALDRTAHFVTGNTGRSVQVTNLAPGIYYVRIHVWDEISCTDNVEMYVLEVIERLPTVELTGDSLCVGEVPFVKIVFTGIAPYDVSLITIDGLQIVNMNGIYESEITVPITQPLPLGTTEFWVMEVTDACTVNSYTVDPPPKGEILIYPKPRTSRIYQVDK